MRTGEIIPYAAACNGTSGDSHTGHRLNDVSINWPRAILYDGEKQVFVSLGSTGVIISIDTTTDQCAVAMTISRSPRIFGYGLDRDTIYVTLNDGFGAIRDGSIEYVIGSGREYTDPETGDVNPTQLTYPMSFAEVEDGRWVIADRDNNR